jgi:ubiquinone/menaquinone biosynthesis C-methylase UbiE
MTKIELEHVSCNLCEKDDYKVIYSKPDTFTWLNQFEYPVVECKQCGLTYVNPRPNQISMSSFYPKDYHSNRDTLEQQNRYKIQIEFLPKLTDEDVLDIGCAKGDFLIRLMEQYPNINASGLDYFSEGVSSEKITFYKKLIQDVDLANHSFDLITAWAVLEHVHDPKLYFKEVSRLLKNDGEFIFLVTNSKSLYGKKAYREDVPRHTYHFSEKVLEQYAMETGLKVQDIVYTDKLFDGKGKGTILNIMRKLVNLSLENMYKKEYGYAKRIILKIGSTADKIVFSCSWESKLKRSGIIVVKMKKSLAKMELR